MKLSWEWWGSLLWLVGSVLFLIAAVRADDPVSALGSAAFVVGALAFMYPQVRRQD